MLRSALQRRTLPTATEIANLRVYDVMIMRNSDFTVSSMDIIYFDGSHKGLYVYIIATNATEKRMNIMLTCHMMGSKYANS
jgi:hypothetical protein